LGFANENVQLLGGNFYAIIFSWRELSSRWERYRDFVPGGISPGSRRKVFSWRDLGEYRFLGKILTEIRGGNFSRERSSWENRPPRRDLGECRESWRDPGRIPLPILQGKSVTALTATQVLEVTARKLLSLKYYLSLKSGISSGDIKNTDITVQKEIHM